MPISKSAKKAHRAAVTKTSRNRYRKDLLKNALKKEDQGAISLIDKAAKWGIIHPNKAARLKSRLAKKLGPNVTSVKTSPPAGGVSKAAPTKAKKSSPASGTLKKAVKTAAKKTAKK